MADEVASLGFAVDSSQLDTAKQKLADVASQSDKTGKSVDDLNQSLSKTADAASKSGSGLGTVTPALSAIDSAARRAGVSVADMQARTAAFNAETAKLAAGGSAAGTAIGAIANAAGPAGSALNALGAASKAVTAEHAAHNAIAATLRETLHGLTPVIGQLGGSIGGLREYAAAARLGIEGLALAAGGAALIELAKLGDEVDRSKARFAGLTGSVESGTAAYDAVKAAAHASGVEFSTLASAVEKASIGQATFADKNVTYANTAANAAKATSSLAAAFGTVASIMQSNLANADEENKALNALGTSFQTTGTLGVKAFQAIQAESPGTALAIARAFGYDKVTDFITQLGKSSLTIDQFVQRIATVKPQVDAAFDPDKPKTFAQALSETESAGKDLVETLAKLGAGDVVKGLFVDLKSDVENLQHPLDTLSQSFQDFSDRGTKSWSDFVTTADDQSSIFGKSITVDVDGAISKVLVTLGELPSSGLASITSWANGAIAEFKSMAASAVSYAQQAVSALSQVGSAAASAANAVGGAVSAAGGAGGTEGIQLGPNSGGDVSSGGGSDAAVISSLPDYSGTSDYLDSLPAFADGGQLTVTGSGGTDSQLVQFNATPGEVVTVSTPGQMAQTSTSNPSGGIVGLTTIQGQPAAGAISATPDPASQATINQLTDAIAQSSIDITKQIDTGNNAIVNELAKLNGGVAAAAVNPATGLPVASTMASSAAVTAALVQQHGLTNNPVFDSQIAAMMGATGGGGPTISGGGGGGAKKPAPDQGTLSAQAYNSANYGYPGGARGTAAPTRHLPGSFPMGAPKNPNIPVNPNYGPGVNPDYGPQQLGLSAFLSDYPGYDTGYATVGDATAAAYNDYGYGDFTGDYSTGGDFGVGGSSVSDVANQYMDSGGYDYGASYDLSGTGGTDTGSTGFDSGDVQGFATGGKFVIGGDGGIDTTPVGFMGTRGETVTITPNGVALPTGVTSNIPTAASDPSAARQQSVTKNITINVANRVQAADFLRSRAQIARGL